MMKWVFGLMIIISVISGIFQGKITEVSNAALNEGINAVEFFIYIIGGMCVWGGVMRIADKAGLTEKLSILFRPLARVIFKGLNLKGKAFKAMTMNIAANLFGLGNAATPLGIRAMKELEKEENVGETASDNMIIFTVLNTASITLIPTTVATLRLKHSSANPLDILPAVIISSILSVTVAIVFTLILNFVRKKRSK
ncbi:MAG: nucleoside recognition domain-containing protein [Oscillospiraceae bacterium]